MVIHLRVASLLCIGLLIQSAQADTIWITSGSATLAYEQIKLAHMDQDNIVFRTPQGNEATYPISKVARLAIDDEHLFTAAEQARSAGQWDVATDSYARTLSSTDKQWLKDWIALRLLESAEKSRRFDMAVTAYAAVAIRSPEYALNHKPSLPEAKSTFLDTGAAQLETALTRVKTDQQKQALLWLELDIYRARSDTAKAAEVAKKLAAIKASSPSTTVGDAGSLLADLKLNSAKLALEHGDYSKAISEIESAKALFTDGSHQADALFCIAQAKQGLANQVKTPEAQKDAALAYLRVAAHFQDVPSAPHVPESLLAAGAIMEQLNDRAGAMRLYQEVISRYNTTSAAATARQSVARLNAK